VIEFEREWQGGSRPTLARVEDIISVDPLDGERTQLYVRSRGEIVVIAPYPRVKRAISLVRNQMVSLINGDL
jgi:hypothetical protein